MKEFSEGLHEGRGFPCTGVLGRTGWGWLFDLPISSRAE